jgi:hypothetical protein
MPDIFAIRVFAAQAENHGDVLVAAARDLPFHRKITPFDASGSAEDGAANCD